jgi:hypothetical protein
MQVQGPTEDGLVKVMGFGKAGRVISHEVALWLQGLQDDSWSPSKRPAIFGQGIGYPNFGTARTTCIKGAPVAGTQDTSLGGRRNLSDRVNAVRVPSAA